MSVALTAMRAAVLTPRGSYANLILKSQASNDAAWTKTAISVSADATAAPDGTTTADKLVEDNTTASHRLRQLIAVAAGLYNYSVYLKAGERGWARLLPANATGSPSLFINLATGAQGTVTGTWVVQDAGNGWWRASTALTMPATNLGADVYVTTGNGVTSYAGDGASGIYVWGHQATAGAALRPYKATV